MRVFVSFIYIFMYNVLIIYRIKFKRFELIIYKKNSIIYKF